MAKPKDGVVDRLRRNLAHMLDPEVATAKPQRAAAPRAPAAPPSPPSAVGTERDFGERIKILLSQSGQTSLLSGRVNMIGLHKIKERFGENWEKFADRADRIARNTIERHLVSGDIYTCLHRVVYVVVFARLSSHQAQVKCTLIADEIAKALLGEDGTNLLTVKTSVKGIDGSFRLENIKLADKAGGSDGELEFVEQETEAAAAADKAAAPAPAQANVLANLRFAYRPMWDNGRNVVSAYRCTAQVPSIDKGAVAVDAGFIDAAIVVGNEAAVIHQLDEAVRGQVLKDLEALLRDNCSLLLSMPVHFETLGAVGRRRQYVEDLGKRLDDRARKLLLIEIQGVPQGVPPARLVEILAPLRAHCRAIMLQLRLDTADFGNVKGCGALAIGCDITGHPGPEFMLMQAMNRFARAIADRAGLPSYLHGANSLSMVTAALGAGFAYIDGDAVAKLIDHPRGLVDFRLADLYRPLTGS
jgi:hypothetical protein